MSLTKAEAKCLQVVEKYPLLSTTAIADHLFETSPHRDPQAYARPAGKVLRSLERKGLVENRPCRARESAWRVVRK